MIDVYSPTWKEMLKFAEKERKEAIEFLIADQDPEQQRGIIKLLDRLIALPVDPEEPVVSDDYT